VMRKCFYPTFGWMLSTCLAPALVMAAPAECPIQLVDVTAQTGIGFRHTDGGSGQRYIVESVVAGLALFDYDRDGWIDIYFLNGAPLKGTVVAVPPRHALYRNNGDWTFTDVTEKAGLNPRGYGLGVTVGDYNNDGDPDLYLNDFGPNVLYRNNGDGTFSDVTKAAGVQRGTQVGGGACFFDMEGDGDLDLFSANYVDFNYGNHIIRKIGPHQFHPGPRDYRGVRANLFKNNGDGTFADVSAASGVGAVAIRGMGVISLDYDDDGDADIFVCNDSGPNMLFQNDGRGKFTESGAIAGLAYDGQGKEHANMGVDCGDYNNDGRLDLFVTGFSAEPPILFRALGGGLFEDATNRSGAAASAFAPADWGTGLVDFDNDGDRDLFIACGHFNDNIQHIDQRTAVKVPNILLMNTGSSKFVDVSTRCGSGLAVVESSRGAAFDDLDNDGDIDAVVLNANAGPTILRNDSPAENHWLAVRLQGVTGNREGIGARVRVVAGDSAQIAEVHSGRGYQSHFGTTLHFGLGKTHPRSDRVEVRWPGSKAEVVVGQDANRVLMVKEGRGAH
jgi:enediyne biosynthesis protein E4